MIERILVVCVGNICRSPMAEALLRARLAGRGIEVGSAGLAGLAGAPIDPTAAAVLADHGLALEDHVARRLSPDMLSAADLVLAMDQRQLSAIRAIAPQARGKSFLLGHWIDAPAVADPYGRPRAAFEECHALITRAVDAWIPRL